MRLRLLHCPNAMKNITESGNNSKSEYLGRVFSSSPSSSDMTMVLLAGRELGLEGIEDDEVEDVMDYMDD